MEEHLLSLLIFSPLVVAAILLFFPAEQKKLFKYGNLAVCLFQLLIVVFLLMDFAPLREGGVFLQQDEAYAFSEKLNWITLDMSGLGKLSIKYFVGVDGLNISMILLTAIVMLIAAISSWRLEKKVKGYFSLLLLLNASVMGCFAALDLFLFFLFFEFMLLPMYFLIGLWGGPRREYAAIKFFVYTLLGSIFILVVMIGLYLSVIDPKATIVEIGLANHGDIITPEMTHLLQVMLESDQVESQNMVHTFSIPDMMNTANYIPGSILSHLSDVKIFDLPIRMLAFLLLMIGFAIKLPAVPFHTWLPDAHVEAPTPVSVILAGVLLKIGAYGMIRIAYGIFPEGGVYFAWWIGLIGLISILYAAFNALAMADIKKMIAYSSVSHMGFVLLGLASNTTEGVSGAIFQMFSHGIITTILFLIAGVLYERTGDRLIENYRGLATAMPYFTAIVVIGFFASLGLPGFSGFIAEILILLGAFSASTNDVLPVWMAIFATLGLVLGAAYYLWTLQRMFFGEFWVFKIEWQSKLRDLSSREYLMFIPCILITLILGIFPHLLLDIVGPSVGSFVNWVNTMGQFNLDLLNSI